MTDSAAAAASSSQCGTVWPKDALRISFGIIWLIDAVLKWLAGFRATYMSTIMGIAKGQPGWLHPWFNFWIDLQHPRVSYYAGPSRYSVDYYLERPISWWWRLAEMRRPIATQPTLAPVSELSQQRRSA